MENPNAKNRYMTVFSHRVSKCRNFLVAGNNYGEVAIFEFASFPSDRERNLPSMRWRTSMRNVYAVESTPRYVLAAGDGPLTLWSWDPILRGSKLEPISTIDVLCRSPTSSHEGYVNALAVLPNATSESVLCGCSDGTVARVDLCTTKVASRLTIGTERRDAKNVASSEEIFCLVLRDENSVVGGTSEGRVLMWDLRESNEPSFCIEPGPHVRKRDATSDTGSWISALDVFEDWLVCGGSMNASLWHLGSRTMSTVYVPEPATAPVHAVAMVSGAGSSSCGGKGLGTVLVGGQGCNVTAFSLDGGIKAQIPTSSSCVYSMDYGRDEDLGPLILSACGSSEKINIFSELVYHAFDFAF